MKFKCIISVLTVAATLLSLSACQSNTNTYTEILSEEEIAEKYTTEASKATATEVIETVELITEPKTEQVTEEIVKTEAETREELISGIITAFCNKDEETFNAYSKGSSSEKYNEIYSTWCESIKDYGFD